MERRERLPPDRPVPSRPDINGHGTVRFRQTTALLAVGLGAGALQLTTGGFGVERTQLSLQSEHLNYEVVEQLTNAIAGDDYREDEYVDEEEAQSEEDEDDENNADDDGGDGGSGGSVDAEDEDDDEDDDEEEEDDDEDDAENEDDDDKGVVDVDAGLERW